MNWLTLSFLLALVLRFGNDFLPDATQVREINSYLQSVPGRVQSEIHGNLSSFLRDWGLD
jgi:hypothetical protein